MDEAEEYRTAVRRYTEDQALPEERGLLSQTVFHKTSSRKPGQNSFISIRSQFNPLKKLNLCFWKSLTFPKMNEI